MEGERRGKKGGISRGTGYFALCTHETAACHTEKKKIEEKKEEGRKRKGETLRPTLFLLLYSFSRSADCVRQKGEKEILKKRKRKKRGARPSFACLDAFLSLIGARWARGRRVGRKKRRKRRRGKRRVSLTSSFSLRCVASSLTGSRFEPGGQGGREGGRRVQRKEKKRKKKKKGGKNAGKPWPTPKRKLGFQRNHEVNASTAGRKRKK